MVAQCGPRGAYSLAPAGAPRLQLRTPVHLATPGGPFHGRYRHRPTRPITCSGAQGTSSGGAAPAAAAVAAAEEQPNNGAVGSGASSSSSTVAGSVEASARDLREEVEQLRTLLAQQAALLAEQQAAAARQQAETAALIAQQQETIRLLEGRFWESSMGKPDASRGAPAAAGAAAAAAAAALPAELEVAVAPADALQPGAEQGDDDPLSFMNPTIADRRVLGSYDARFHSTNW